MNPVILYKNTFESGKLIATDTASGFDVDNIADLNPDTFWKAASYGTKYITSVPRAGDSLAQEEMRISPADGYAGVYLPASLDLTPYLGDRIVCLDSVLKKHIGYIKSIGNKAVNMTAAAAGSSGIKVNNTILASGSVTLANMRLSLIGGAAFADFSAAVFASYIGKRLIIIDSAGKKAVGYIKAAGTGETYGSNLITEWTNLAGHPYETFTSSGANITSAIETGVDGQAYTNYWSITKGMAMKGVINLTLNSGTMQIYGWMLGGGGSYAIPNQLVTNGEHSYYYSESLGGSSGMLYIRSYNASNYSATFTLKQILTPSSTGVTITSTPNGSTYNWESIETGFNYNDAAGYTYQITDYNLEMGTNHFTMAWEGVLPDWTPGTDYQILMVKWLNSVGIVLGIRSTGHIYVQINATLYTSTVVSGLTDGTKHKIRAVVTRSSATVAGSVVIYVDKVQLGTSIPIPAGVPATVSNAAELQICGYTTSRIDSVTQNVYLFNRNLSAAEIIDLDDNVVATADQYGNQTVLNVSNCVNNNYDTFDGASPTGFHVIEDGVGDWRIAGTADEIPLVYGKNIVVEFDLAIASGVGPAGLYLADTLSALRPSAITNTPPGNGHHVYKTTYLPSTPFTGNGVVFFFNRSQATEYTVSNLKVYRGGVTLALEESGIGDTGWEDSSTNGNDASYPVSGSAVVRFNDIVSTSGGSTYNWESKETGYNHEDAGGYAYLIDTADEIKALGIMGHNLGTAGAGVSVESSDDGTNWTERLASFTPSSDNAILKALTSYRAAIRRLKIVTTSIAPYVAEAWLAEHMEMPYPPDAPMAPYEEGIESEMTLSRGGRTLGVVTSYFPIDIQHRFSNLLRTWAADNFVPFWEYAKYLYPFFYAPDLDTWPDDVFFCTVSPDMKFKTPVSVLLYVDSIDLIMRGYRK